MEVDVPLAQDESLEILVVDDQQDIREEMVELLEDLDRPVRCAGSGDEALECVSRGNIGLVLMDVEMPRMGGFEAARRMRAEPQSRYTPIIFISGLRQTDAVLNEGYTSGAVDFLTKPVQPAVLLHKARILLEHEQYRRSLLRLTQQLEQERAFNASILDNTAEGILVVGDDGRVRYANPAITRMLGCSSEELQGSDLLSWVESPHENNWQTSVFHDSRQRGDNLRLHDANLRGRDGSNIPVAMSCSPLPGEQQSMTVLAVDMSVVRDLHRQLELQAITDALTGLLNRRGFMQALHGAVSRTQRTGSLSALLYLDLDGFKLINDTLSHEKGDEVLRWVSVQMQACLRPYDRLARIGGDEFAVIVDSMHTPADAAAIAQKLIEQVTVDEGPFRLGASIGIAFIPSSGNHVEDILRAADAAMYAAKRGGKGQYRFHETVDNVIT
nr:MULTISPECIES: diguanylate cyclase [unclassified Pseudomonas]